MKQFILSILILTSTSLYAQCQGDMNDDGIINVVDIITTINLILDGDTECEEQSVHGCLDSQACNYDSGALIDNNSCYFCYNDDCDTYPEDEYDCDGSCLFEVDCLGVCNGLALIDDCGLCDDNPMNDNTECEQDCTGEWGGSATFDQCGVCNGDGSSCSDDTFIAIFTAGGSVYYEIPHHIELTSNAGYIISGETNLFIEDVQDCGNPNRDRGYLLKVNSYGTEEWSRILPQICMNSNQDFLKIFYAEETIDGNYIVMGFENTWPSGIKGYISKRNVNNGDEIWTTYINDINSSNSEVSGQHTSDGGYVITGRNTNNNGDLVICKIDENGNIEWTRTHAGPYTDYATSIRETSDGGYILIGPYGYRLLKVDSNGFIEWNNDELTGYEIDLASDGGYIVTGGHLVKTDSQGNIEWSYSKPCISGTTTADGGYACTGNGPDTETINDIGLYKLDSYGNEEWVQTFGHSDTSEWGASIQQTNDGGYIILAQGGSDYIIIKTDSQGNTVDWPE